MVVLEKDYLRIIIDRSIKLMYSEWLRPVNSEEYRAGNLLLLQQLNEYGILNWIADSEVLGNIDTADEQWTLAELIPGIVQSSLSKIARISGYDKANYTKFEEFAKRAEDIYIGQILVRQFMTYKEAADWIGEIIA
ncbi:hypothetical protein [Pontibacter cellulosilyticus]|uniref:Uncharacterized protein n=1 Tax=Pontibacter cellulosilyticus TaxID=1720253 RepID=A0A923SQD4_9BACT|nr:hypothetical protein [Pontibacter cellulosilyticus]MBC5995050.1 hypothetical protein [Pontibacter cellulosilyticus]